MTKKPNKAARSQAPRSSPESAPGRPASPKVPDLSGNDHIMEILRPTPRRQALFPAIPLSPSIAQVARHTGVSQRTLRRWLDDPAFRTNSMKIEGSRPMETDFVAGNRPSTIPVPDAYFPGKACPRPERGREFSPPQRFPAPDPSFPHPTRHSRGSGNPGPRAHLPYPGTFMKR